MVGGRRPLLPEILGQRAPVGAKSLKIPPHLNVSLHYLVKCQVSSKQSDSIITHFLLILTVK